MTHSRYVGMCLCPNSTACPYFPSLKCPETCEFGIMLEQPYVDELSVIRTND